jgi:HAD superfamily hydrolase (TIGR01509 family)
MPFPPSPLAALLIDMDGVVIDSEPLHERAFQEAAEALGIEIPREAVLEVKGMAASDAFARLAEAHGEERVGAQELREAKQSAFREALRGEGAPLVAGAKHLLGAAQAAGLRLALVTSSPPWQQALVFEQHALAGYFDAVVTAEDVEAHKPEPGPYLEAARRLAVDPAKCVVLEDATNGVRSGVAAGCHVLGITTSFEAEALLGAGAIEACATLEEAATLLRLPPR